jgi:RNA polymerase sigma factor (sigma-70 family)
MQVPDEEIIQRVQRGEREAYMVLFDRYYTRVESYARRQLHHAEAARDLASETFLRAYRSVDSFRTGGISYLGYLLMICRRLILTEQARQRIAPIHSLEEREEETLLLADPAAHPLDRLLTAERDAMLREALMQLSSDDREIIHLAFERGLSRRDIGEILGKPTISAVTSHLYRAMQKLKAIVAKQDYFSAGHGVGQK